MGLLKKARTKSLEVCADIMDRRYSKRMQRKLRDRDFLIICPTCIGGVMYHRLGMEFLSPTINLWMSQPDFIKFASRLKEYLDKELVFAPDEAAYPVGMLDDVKIHFSHYKSEEQARIAWDRRKARVRFDNLFLILFDRDGITREDMLKFGEIPCKNRIILSDREFPDIPYVKTVRPNNNDIKERRLMDKDWKKRWTFEKKWDYVQWLNTQEQELRNNEKIKAN